MALSISRAGQPYLGPATHRFASNFRPPPLRIRTARTDLGTSCLVTLLPRFPGVSARPFSLYFSAIWTSLLIFIGLLSSFILFLYLVPLASPSLLSSFLFSFVCLFFIFSLLISVIVYSLHLLFYTWVSSLPLRCVPLLPRLAHHVRCHKLCRLLPPLTYSFYFSLFSFPAV